MARPLHFTFLVVALASLATAQASDRAVGATDRGCRSSFAVGYTRCSDVSPAAASLPASAAQRVVAHPPSASSGQGGSVVPSALELGAGVSEADVDAILANHGKPSREAARALLDPTDENIAAMARRVRQDAAVAAYVAGRMTALQEIDPGLVAINPSFNSEDLPWLAGMRLVLHVAVGCQPCQAAATTLQRLVAESPVLDARVVVHGAADARALTLELARMGITLPATPATTAHAQFARVVPTAMVADMRQGRQGLLTQFGNTQQLRHAIAAFRRAGASPNPNK